MMNGLLIGLVLVPVYFILYMLGASIVLFIDNEIKAYIKERNEQ